MLRTSGLNTYYGHVQALREASIFVRQREIVVVLGANGAGKSTLLNTIAGIIPLRSGSITINGVDASFLKSHDMIRRGIVLVPERRELFAPLSVEENLELGTYHWRSQLSNPKLKEELGRVYSLFPRLAERRKQTAGTLSGGEQQMLAIGRGLMSKPQVFLLDEPSLGLAPLVKAEIFQTLRHLNSEQSLTILLVEQDTKLALTIAHRGYVMQAGRVVLEGEAQDLASNPQVQEIYFGHRNDARASIPEEKAR